MADKISTGECGEILIYQTDNGQTNIEVKIEDDTVWLTQQQMSELFQTSRTNVVEHIKHIYEEGELDEISTCRNFRQVRKEGNREVTRQIPHYNLERPKDENDMLLQLEKLMKVNDINAKGKEN
ncbi:MAG: cell filamentation protein Fic [Lachnospiraceae bacterium]|nr:cell filamentation protein Fic [Lachnospiraceae bacterium]